MKLDGQRGGVLLVDVSQRIGRGAPTSMVWRTTRNSDYGLWEDCVYEYQFVTQNALRQNVYESLVPVSWASHF